MSILFLIVNDLCVIFLICKVGSWLWIFVILLYVVGGVSFQLNVGECFGVVGESGFGKLMVVCVIMGLVFIFGGEVFFEGQDFVIMLFVQCCQLVCNVQMVFQDLLVVLNLCMIVGEIIVEFLIIYEFDLFKVEVCQCVVEMMEWVGLLLNFCNCYLYEFLGGQCQCIGIVCVLILKFKLLICDEFVFVLDVFVQVQVVNLLMDL